MKRRVSIITLVLGLAIVLSAGVCHAEPPVKISIDKRHVVLGDSCTFSVRTDKELAVPPQVPPVDGLSIQYAGAQKETSSHFQLVINGRNVQTNKSGGGIKYYYRIFPQKIGTYQFPAVDVTIGNKTYRTNPFTIEVTDQGEQSEHIFLVQELDKKEAFIGEKINYRFKWYFNKDIEGYECNIPWLSSLDDFIVQDPDLDKTRQYQRLIINGTQEVYAEKTSEIREGKRYAVVSFEKTLIPMKTGTYELGSAFLRCDVVKAYHRPQRRSFFDDFFHNDFDSFFGIGRQAITEPFITRSEPFTITVKKVPEENQPKDYSNGIGQFVFRATVSPTTVKEGEPVTISMYIGGAGNVEHVVMPAVPELDGFRGYDPESSLETKRVSGKDVIVKTFKKVVIPTLEGSYEIPELVFSYFDTVTRSYERLTQGPFTITVEKGDAPEQDVRVVTVDDMFSANKKKIAVVRHDIHFIKTQLGEVHRRTAPLYRNPVVVAGLVICPLILLFVLRAYNKHRMRYKTDVSWARKQGALKKAIRALQECGQSAKGASEWYFSVGKVLSDFVVEKCSLSAASITPDMLDDIAAAGVSDDSIVSLSTILEKLDGARFGLIHESESDKQAFIHEITVVISRIDKEVK